MYSPEMLDMFRWNLLPFSDDLSVSKCKNGNNVLVLKAKIDLN